MIFMVNSVSICPVGGHGSGLKSRILWFQRIATIICHPFYHNMEILYSSVSPRANSMQIGQFCEKKKKNGSIAERNLVLNP